MFDVTEEDWHSLMETALEYWAREETQETVADYLLRELEDAE